MEIFTIEMIWYIFSVTCLLLYYVYVSKKDWKKYQAEINDWKRQCKWEQDEYNSLHKHAEWLDSALRRVTLRYEEEKNKKEKILEQARYWKSRYLKLEKMVVFLMEQSQRLDLKNKELHKKIVNDSRPLQGAKKTWKIKKPNTISRSQVYRRKKEVCEQ